MAHFMIVVLIIMAALGLRSLSDGAGDNKLPLRTIARNGSAHSCPSKELLESERQAISATVRRKISDKLYQIPHNCKEALNDGMNMSGVYLVQPDDYAPLDVYCDMETDGGGWTVFQRRQDGSEDFYRGWDDYVTGFGNLTGEFWLGLENIYRLTKRNVMILLVDLGDFEQNTAFAKYETFCVLDSSSNYTLNVTGYSGTAGDSLFHNQNHYIINNGMQFSTFDRDNDRRSGNCAIMFKGAWWYNHCHASNLNGLYHRGSHDSYADGVNWRTWKGYHYSLKFTEMKLQ